MAIDSVRDVDSIDRKIENEKGKEMNVIDTIAAEGDKSGEIVDNILLNTAIEHLDERERMIVNMRYMEELTQRKEKKKIGVSQVQVSRLEKKILKKLRGFMSDAG